MLRASAGLPNTVTNAGTSLPIAVPMPKKLCAPMQQNWMKRVKPDRIAQSSTHTCPASGVVDQNAMVTDHAVMADMGIGHDQVVIAKGWFLLRSCTVPR